MPKCLVRLKSTATPTLAAGRQSSPYGGRLTTETPASGDRVMFCALSVHAPNSKAQKNICSHNFFVLWIKIAAKIGGMRDRLCLH